MKTDKEKRPLQEALQGSFAYFWGKLTSGNYQKYYEEMYKNK